MDLDEEWRTLERCKEEIIVRRARVAYLERIKADDHGNRNLWRSGMPVLTTWKQKAKKHTGKKFRSRLAQDRDKKRKIDKVQNLSSPARRIRYLSKSEVCDSTRRVVCISADEEVDELGSGPTQSVPELVSIVTVRPNHVRMRERMLLYTRSSRSWTNLLHLGVKKA